MASTQDLLMQIGKAVFSILEKEIINELKKLMRVFKIKKHEKSLNFVEFINKILYVIII